MLINLRYFYPDMIGFLIANVQWSNVDAMNAARKNIMRAQGGNRLIFKTNGGCFPTCSIIRLIDYHHLSWDLVSAWKFHLGAFLGAWPVLLTGFLSFFEFDCGVNQSQNRWISYSGNERGHVVMMTICFHRIYIRASGSLNLDHNLRLSLCLWGDWVCSLPCRLALNSKGPKSRD
jgi:hypothetical protein